MKTRYQRMGLILLMVAAVVYTIYNYSTGRTDLPVALASMVFMGWLLFGQIGALIRERDEE